MKLNFNVKTKVKSSEELLKVQKKVLFKCMIKMRNLARHYVPVDTGILKNSIHIFPMEYGSEKYTLSDGVEYGIFVEYGTSPHIIKPVNKEALAFEWTEFKGKMLSTKGRRENKISKSQATMAVFKEVHHPGTQMQPYFRPALDQVKYHWLNTYWNEELNKP